MRELMRKRRAQERQGLLGVSPNSVPEIAALGKHVQPARRPVREGLTKPRATFPKGFRKSQAYSLHLPSPSDPTLTRARCGHSPRPDRMLNEKAQYPGLGDYRLLVADELEYVENLYGKKVADRMYADRNTLCGVCRKSLEAEFHTRPVARPRTPLLDPVPDWSGVPTDFTRWRVEGSCGPVSLPWPVWTEGESEYDPREDRENEWYTEDTLADTDDPEELLPQHKTAMATLARRGNARYVLMDGSGQGHIGTIKRTRFPYKGRNETVWYAEEIPGTVVDQDAPQMTRVAIEVPPVTIWAEGQEYWRPRLDAEGSQVDLDGRVAYAYWAAEVDGRRPGTVKQERHDDDDSGSDDASGVVTP